MLELEPEWRALMDWMVAHPREVLRHRRDLHDRLIKARCNQGDRSMPIALLPLFLKPSELELIRRTSEILDGVVDKTIGLYFEDAYVRSHFPLHTELPPAWLASDPGYQKPTLLSRHDVLYDGKTLKYIEFNTDNPGGRGWVDLIDSIVVNHPLYQRILDLSHRPSERPITQGMFDAVTAVFKEVGLPKNPRVAFVNLAGLSGVGDAEIARDFFACRGIEGAVIDPRDFELKGGALHSGGVRYDAFIRTMTAWFFLRYPRDMAAFMEGALAGAGPVINSFRGTLGSHKSLLSFITNPLNHGYFTELEAQTIRDHVPWTRRLDEVITLSPEGGEVSLKAFMLKERERLVLKPNEGAGGYGVQVGKTTDPAQWRESVEDNMGAADWIVQEAVNIPQLGLPVIRDQQVHIEERFLNLSPYVFGGKFVGILGRYSAKNVVNVSAGGGLIPVYGLAKGQDLGEVARGLERAPA